jgi:hypothetical protein
MPYAVILLRPRVSRPWCSPSGTWERYPAPTSPTTLPAKLPPALTSRPSARLTLAARPKGTIQPASARTVRAPRRVPGRSAQLSPA